MIGKSYSDFSAVSCMCQLMSSRRLLHSGLVAKVPSVKFGLSSSFAELSWLWLSGCVSCRAAHKRMLTEVVHINCMFCAQDKPFLQLMLDDAMSHRLHHVDNASTVQ